MFTKMGAVLTGATAERESTPVRKQSYAAGRCEAVFWRRTNCQDVRKIVLAARRYELTGRQSGSRNGPLGGVAIELLELFANLVNFRTGRLDPSIETLMRYLRRSRDAIVRALKALRQHGFLDWLRRYVPTGNQGRGPRVRQTSNAYRLSMPKRALRLLGYMGKVPPPPDDHTHAVEAKVAEINAYRKSLPMNELALFDVGDSRLGRALARLGNSIKQRESAKQNESPSSYVQGRKR